MAKKKRINPTIVPEDQTEACVPSNPYSIANDHIPSTKELENVGSAVDPDLMVIDSDLMNIEARDKGEYDAPPPVFPPNMTASFGDREVGIVNGLLLCRGKENGEKMWESPCPGTPLMVAIGSSLVATVTERNTYQELRLFSSRGGALEWPPVVLPLAMPNSGRGLGIHEVKVKKGNDSIIKKYLMLYHNHFVRVWDLVSAEVIFNERLAVSASSIDICSNLNDENGDAITDNDDDKCTTTLAPFHQDYRPTGGSVPIQVCCKVADTVMTYSHVFRTWIPTQTEIGGEVDALSAFLGALGNNDVRQVEDTFTELVASFAQRKEISRMDDILSSFLEGPSWSYTRRQALKIDKNWVQEFMLPTLRKESTFVTLVETYADSKGWWCHEST